MLSGSAPTVLISGAPEAPEGSRYLLNLTVSDPENDPVTGWTINWGDGTVQAVSGNPSTVPHTYPAGPNGFSITASAVVDGVSYAARVSDAGRFLDVFVAPGSGGLDFPSAMVFGPDGNLYVANWLTSGVHRYDGATGAFMDVFVTPGSGGLSGSQGIAFGPDGNLYVSSFEGHSVLRYDGTTGAFLDAFVTPGSGGLERPLGLVFGPDGYLYVCSLNGSLTYRYNGTTGSFIDDFTTIGSNGKTAPLFGPDGYLYLNGAGGARVDRYDVTSTTSTTRIDTFIPPFYGNITEPYGMTFGPDGDLYLSSLPRPTMPAILNRVVRYDGTTGEMIDVYAAGPEQDGTFALAFGPDGNLYVSSAYNDSIFRYSGPLTAGTATQLPVRVLDVSAYKNTKRQSIPPKGSLQSTLRVPDSFTVADVNVTLDITHTIDSNLRVFLISPAGTRVELFTNVGGSGDNFTNTTVDDEARLPFSFGSAPFTGSFYPEGLGSGRLSAFDGQSAQGTWVLEITDSAPGSSGKLNSWRLDLARGFSPLRAESIGVSDSVESLTPPLAVPLLAEALSRWQAAGADVSPLRGLDLQITDLGHDVLGLAAGNTIWLDDDGAGWGWYLDATPGDDLEYLTPGNQGEQGRIDLLTVLVHELGHLLGHDHDEDGVMAETLAPGTRPGLDPEAAALQDRLFAERAVLGFGPWDGLLAALW